VLPYLTNVLSAVYLTNHMTNHMTNHVTNHVTNVLSAVYYLTNALSAACPLVLGLHGLRGPFWSCMLNRLVMISSSGASSWLSSQRLSSSSS